MLTFERRNELKSNSQTTMIMNTKGLILSAIIVAMGMTAAGVAIRNGIVTFKDRDRCVVVKGLAEREVKANKVSWPLTYKEIGNNPSEMYNIIEHKNKQVVDFLKAGGVKDNEISVNSPTISDRQASSYNNEVMTYRYVAKSVITVTSTNVDLVRGLITKQAELMRQGIALVSEEYGTDQITYSFTGLNDIKPAMVEEATFFFIDMDYRSKKTGSTTRGVVGAYWEVSRDFTFAKVKDSNVSFTAHGEYNGGLNQTGPFQQCILVGPALQWHNDDFRKTFTFQALYKHMLKGNGVDGHASFQTTAVWGVTFANDLCTFSGFADLWYAQTPKNVYKGKQGSDQRGLIFLTEPQFWFNIVNRHSANNKLSIGTEWELSNNFVWYNAAKSKRSFYWNPTIALKWSI